VGSGGFIGVLGFGGRGGGLGFLWGGWGVLGRGCGGGGLRLVRGSLVRGGGFLLWGVGFLGAEVLLGEFGALRGGGVWGWFGGGVGGGLEVGGGCWCFRVRVVVVFFLCGVLSCFLCALGGGRGGVFCWGGRFWGGGVRPWCFGVRGGGRGGGLWVGVGRVFWEVHLGGGLFLVSCGVGGGGRGVFFAGFFLAWGGVFFFWGFGGGF